MNFYFKILFLNLKWTKDFLFKSDFYSFPALKEQNLQMHTIHSLYTPYTPSSFPFLEPDSFGSVDVTAQMLFFITLPFLPS